MNKLLKFSFDKYGYDYDFLVDIHKNKYDDGYVFKDEDVLLLGLERLRKSHSKIVICPDFDMDGISAGAVFYAGLSLLGLDVVLYAPNVDEGYGIRPVDVDRILERWPDVKAVLTCDVGVSCVDAVSYMRSKGLEVFVTDHHLEPEGVKVDANAVVDPSRRDGGCDFTGVCGAYVAYHVVSTYAKLIGNEAVIALVRHLSLFAALGSCGDLMPVVYDTRDVLTKGVKEFNELLDADEIRDYFCCDPWLLPDVYVMLFMNMRRLHFWLLRHNNIKTGDVTDVDFGFTYCPMFNSVKRMGGQMQMLYSLLYANTSDDDFDKLAGWLWDLNMERKTLVNEMFASMTADNSQLYAPYIYVVDCRPGVLGLLAMKVMTATGLPCLVVCESDGLYFGSGRVPAHIGRGVLEFDGVSMEGHEGAFGIVINKDRMSDYYVHVCDSVVKRIRELSSGDISDPRLVVAMGGHGCYDNYDFSIVTADDYDLCFDYAVHIEDFRPFGRGFEEPEWILKFTKSDVLDVRTMGKSNEHLRVELPFNIRMVLFGGTSRYLDIIKYENDPEHVFQFVGRFSINDFNGCRSLQFIASGIVE